MRKTSGKRLAFRKKIKEAWIIAPVKDTYPLENGVKVVPS